MIDFFHQGSRGEQTVYMHFSFIMDVYSFNFITDAGYKYVIIYSASSDSCLDFLLLNNFSLWLSFDLFVIWWKAPRRL